jgi:DHA2 family multidrug resistance protein
MMAQGMDAVTAAHQAYAALFSMVERQAAMLSYVDAFRFLSAMFVMVLPLIFIMKKPKGPGGPGSMGH